MAKVKKTTVYIKGMHCPSCEVLINDKFKEEKNVLTVKPDFKKQEAEISYTGHINKDSLNKKIQPFGYEIRDNNSPQQTVETPWGQRFFEAVTIGTVLVIIYILLRDASLLPNFSLNTSLSFIGILTIGLVASTSTCMATSGALFLSTVGKNENNFVKALTFNLGRIVSYGFFGFVVGFIGQSLVTALKIGPALMFIAAVFMILLGLDMARIISFATIIPYGATKGIFEKLEHLFVKNPKKMSFVIGALTYFLPCGFTQAVQVYALGLASPIQSSLTMMIFAAGTMPALLLIGGLGSFTKNKFYPYFMKTMGVVVFILGFYYFSNFLSLYGININFLSNSSNPTGDVAAVKNGVQSIEMKVNNRGYVPNIFTVKKDIPVHWKITGENVFGCQASFIVPKLGIQKTFQLGDNSIDFTPKEAGAINFSCGMGMYRGVIQVI